MKRNWPKWYLIPVVLLVAIDLYYMKLFIPNKDEIYEYSGNGKYPKRQMVFSPSFLQCKNVLTNLTRGRWIKKIFFLQKGSEQYQELVKEEEFVEKEMENYRLARGIYKTPYRKDKKCGYSNFAEVPTESYWAPSGSWCDIKSNISCCSNEDDGLCVTTYEASGCNCTRCVDMKKYVHADVSDWHPIDGRCQRKNYTASALCDVMEKFTTVHFIGDSIMRKVFRAFLLTLTSDINHGAFSVISTPEKEKLCIGNDQFYWSNCRTHGSSLDQFSHQELFCGGKRMPSFLAISQSLYNFDYSKEFFNLIKGLSGRPGSVVLLGVGLHMQLKTQEVIDRYVHPAVNYSETYFDRQLTLNHSIPLKRWPLIIFVPPDTPGLLKQKAYMKLQGKKAVNNYKEKMREYCEKHNIPVLDFGDLTANVHSYDGAHYGRALNLMKVQILLNYLDSLVI